MVPDIQPLVSAGQAATHRAGTPNDDARLRAAAEKMEASFLSEMLKSAGAGAARDSFGGGAGEEQFTSFLRDAQASEMVKAGGIGLAESLFEAMKSRGLANGG
jgi:Rod binding domain-containing protein